MPSDHWRQFFLICHGVLGRGASDAWASETWCAWTTFESLAQDIRYWTAGLPNPEDLESAGVNDGGIWMEPVLYTDLAHVIVPARFLWERGDGPDYQSGSKSQDIRGLSAALASAGIEHRLTNTVLEIKLY